MAGTAATVGYFLAGDTDLKARLLLLGDKAIPAALMAVRTECEGISSAAKKEAPVMDGHLRSSIHATPAKIEGTAATGRTVAGGPAASYAFSVHENPRAGKTEGKTPSGGKRKKWAQVGKWHYLIDPFNAAQVGMLDRMGATIKSQTEI